MNEEYIKDAFDSGFQIIFFTARPEKYRDVTVRWLKKHFPYLGNAGLRMRPDGDALPSEEVKRDMLLKILTRGPILCAYDDNERVLEMYARHEVNAVRLSYPTRKAAPGGDTSAILVNMGETFAERNKEYGDNYKKVAPIMKILFPEGVGDLVFDDRWHLFELIVVKLTRFATGKLSHVDSIHDTAVYAAMIESLLREAEK
jgi:hypothetical protein